MRAIAWIVIVALILLGTILVLPRPPGPWQAEVAPFALGETWQYAMEERLRTSSTDESRTWVSTLQVLDPDVATSKGSATLVDYDGSFMKAILGPSSGPNGTSEAGYLMVDVAGWELVGTASAGEMDTPAPYGQAVPPPVSHPCEGKILFVEDPGPVRVHLAPQSVLGGSTWNGTWNHDGTTWRFLFEHVETGSRDWNGTSLPATHVRLSMWSMDGRMRTEIDYWYTPVYRAVLDVARHTVEEGPDSWFESNARVTLSRHDVRSVQPVEVVERSEAIPTVADVTIRPDDPSPVIIDAAGTSRTRGFHLVKSDGTGWIPDPAAIDVVWSLISNYTVLQSVTGPRAELEVTMAGYHYVTAQIRSARCVLGPSWTKVDAPSELARRYQVVPTVREQNWTVLIDPGVSHEIVIDQLGIGRDVSAVTTSARWIGAGTAPSDGWDVLFRTPANNDIDPSPSLPPGDYRIIWRAQGAAGGPVIGDDWELTLRTRYG